MACPEKTKPATDSSAPALSVEQLGGPLDENNNTTIIDRQARLLRQRFALGYYIAATIASLAFAVSR